MIRCSYIFFIFLWCFVTTLPYVKSNWTNSFSLSLKIQLQFGCQTCHRRKKSVKTSPRKKGKKMQCKNPTTPAAYLRQPFFLKGPPKKDTEPVWNVREWESWRESKKTYANDVRKRRRFYRCMKMMRLRGGKWENCDEQKMICWSWKKKRARAFGIEAGARAWPNDANKNICKTRKMICLHFF